MARSIRRLLNRHVIVSRREEAGTTGGGIPIYGEREAGLLRARIELVGLGGRSLAPTEVTGPDNQAIVSSHHALAELEMLEIPEPPDPGEPDPEPAQIPADLSERDTIIDPLEGAAYDVLAATIVDGRVDPHHYELKLRKVTP